MANQTNQLEIVTNSTTHTKKNITPAGKRVK